MRAEPGATYRLQLRPGFGFAEAADLVSYLAALGVTHLYLSPCLQARAGSTHGYDVVDFERISETLGGAGAWEKLHEALSSHGLGILLDFVPNHMAIAGLENPWWWNVLENGPASFYARFFDIDWHAPAVDGQGLLLPVLADQYGSVLERGEIRLERSDIRFVVRAGEHVFPVAPRSLFEILAPAADRAGSDLLAFLARALRALPSPQLTDHESVERRHRDKEALYRLLGRTLAEEERSAAAVDAEIEQLQADPDRFDAFLRQQNYRLAHWRIAARDLPYRRFFDIDSLVALRMEDRRVFAATHHRVLGWLAEGRIDGLRLDHVDGLRDPHSYLEQLRAACPGAWLLVEKILEPGEQLPEEWPVEGTTGYDFLNLVGGLFVDPAGERAMDALYAAFLGETVPPFPTLAAARKRQVLGDLLGSDLRRLAELFAAVCERHRRHRDHLEQDLEEALLEAIAQLPVYRSYVRAEAGACSPRDVAVVSAAMAAAAREREDLPAEIFAFLEDILLLRERGELEGELAMRFQQLSAPAAAKGVEDTALYSYNRLVCLNEVGSDPGRFGVRPETFHEASAEALSRTPWGLLATSTHDTKRSEDVRARLALLSEIPDAWADAVQALSRPAAPYRSGDLPDRNAEYLLYQTLVGTWPISAERALAYMEKAAREAKTHTSWRHPDADYETALRRFVEGVLADPDFCSELERFVTPLLEPARTNGLAQTLLKTTAPGVPDFYQGSELWDLSLVDPDNRRPVDFGLRRRLLAGLEDATPEAVMARGAEGAPKLWLIRQALALRARRPALFGPRGSYEPLAVRGPKRDHAVAFLRGGGAAVVVPRLVLGLAGDWADTTAMLPEASWRNVLTGEDCGGGDLLLGKLLERFPVALLEREGGAE